jgi:hypothetical protein
MLESGPLDHAAAGPALLDLAELPPEDALPDCAECADADDGADCCCDCPIQTIDAGQVSGYRLGDPQFRGLRAVIQNQNAWSLFWGRHTAHLDPAPPLPPVDFSTTAVLIALLGPRPGGGGPAIHIMRATRCQGATIVHVAVNNRPGPEDNVSNPFHIVRVPRTCLAATGTVGFVSHGPPPLPAAVIGRVFAVTQPGGPADPLPGAEVRLLEPGPEPGLVAEAVTGDAGAFVMPDVAPGHYLIVAGAEGFAPDPRSIRIRPGRATVVDFVLRPGEPPEDPPDEP